LTEVFGQVMVANQRIKLRVDPPASSVKRNPNRSLGCDGPALPMRNPQMIRLNKSRAFSEVRGESSLWPILGTAAIPGGPSRFARPKVSQGSGDLRSHSRRAQVTRAERRPLRPP
jgi:hypothetical protein